METNQITVDEIFVRDVKLGNIIDIGSGIGTFTEQIAVKLNGSNFKVYAIEPDENTFSQLKSNVDENPNVETFFIAITDSDGLARLYENSDGTKHTTNEKMTQFISRGYHPIKFVETTVAKTLDTFVIENNITNLTGLNIDGDAIERFVLEGAVETLKNNNLLIALSVYNGSNINKIFDLLTSLEYKIYDDKMNVVDNVLTQKKYICKKD